MARPDWLLVARLDSARGASAPDAHPDITSRVSPGPGVVATVIRRAAASRRTRAAAAMLRAASSEARFSLVIPRPPSQATVVLSTRESVGVSRSDGQLVVG